MELRARALVVDDLAEGRLVLADRLAAAGFRVDAAEDGLEAYRAFQRDAPDVIVTDAEMPRMNGLALVRRVRAVSDVPIVVITAYASIAHCEEALRIGADRYLQLRRDLDRVGEVARELLAARGRDARAGAARGPGEAEAESADRAAMTAEEARAMARRELRAELERQVVLCRGNIAEIARRMGRDPSTVRYHLARLGLLDAPPRPLRRRSIRRGARARPTDSQPGD